MIGKVAVCAVLFSVAHGMSSTPIVATSYGRMADVEMHIGKVEGIGNTTEGLQRNTTLDSVSGASRERAEGAASGSARQWVSGWVIVALKALLAVTAYEVVIGLADYFVINSREKPLVRPELLAVQIFNPTCISAMHIIRFTLIKLNYIVHIVWCSYYMLRVHYWPFTTGNILKPPSMEPVVDYILETSFIIFLAPEGGEEVYRLHLENFASPMYPGDYSQVLSVLIDVKAREIKEFKYNTIDIESETEMLSLLALVAATYNHPLVHSFNDALYAHKDGSTQYDEVFQHSQSLNHKAHFWPGVFFREGVDWFQEVLVSNSRLQLPRHSTKSLSKLLPYSRVGRFLLEARAATFRCVHRHRVAVHPELLFICSTLHSIDHFMYGKLLSCRHLEHFQMPNKGMWRWNAQLFYQPNSYEWIHHNTLKNAAKRETDKHGFYNDLFSAFDAADSYLAEKVTLSISY